MDIKRTLELLKQKSKEAVYIGSLHYNNHEYLPWRRNIEDILETEFGVNSTEYKRVADRTLEVQGSPAKIQRSYVRYIQRIQQEVNSIIQKHEILGVEDKPADFAESKDSAEFPISLFDVMHFHTKVVEVSRGCFTAGNYREAILNAFICLIDYIKEKTNLDLDGDDLMSRVFSITYDREKRKITKYPIIRVNELKNQTDRDEQQGFMFLCKGAVAGIRNPHAHRVIPQSNPLHTLEYLAFASLLIRTVEKGKIVKTRPSKINEEIFLTRCRDSKHEKAVELYLKAKELRENRKANGDVMNWGSSGYSYRIPWGSRHSFETIFTALGDGSLSVWPDVLVKSGETGQKYIARLCSNPAFSGKAADFRPHKYPNFSTDQMDIADIDAFISAVRELGHSLDQVSKEQT